MLHRSSLVNLGLGTVPFVLLVEIRADGLLLAHYRLVIVVDRLIMNQSTLGLIGNSLVIAHDLAGVGPIPLTHCAHMTIHQAFI